MFDDFEVISTYTRVQAIEDGVLIDLSANFPVECRQLYKYPVACTAAVWALIEKAVASTEFSNDLAGIVWDILWMSQKGIVEQIDPTQHIFEVIIADGGTSPARHGNPRNHTYRLRAVCGPGDNAEPVITILLPNED